MDHIEATMLAYVAGIIDGEGCITINRYRPRRPDLVVRYTPYLQVGNTSRPLIDLLQRNFGGLVMRRPARPHHKEFWVWQLPGPRAAQLLTAVRPYLVVKSPQADLLIAYVRGFRRFKGGTVAWRQAIASDELPRRASIHRQISELNRTGPTHAPGTPPEPLD